MSKSKKEFRDCNNCAEKLYVGDGDNICGENPTMLVIEDFGCPAEDYLWCDGDLWKPDYYED